VVKSVVNDLQSRAEEKRIELNCNIADEIIVRADADRLGQVLFNLVDNAIKYGRKEGRVLINAHQNGDAKVEISVEDDGPGIPAEAQERVFERFYRVDKARSREQGGTGLGLSIVKHIVQSHGGKVWVKSEIGKGSTFYFTVAKADPDAKIER
jgi:two-component system phosphate regulon sensor histidine kinase PhoR